jgi:hypothetical protein
LKAVDSSVLVLESDRYFYSHLWHLSQNITSPVYEAELSFLDPLEEVDEADEVEEEEAKAEAEAEAEEADEAEEEEEEENALIAARHRIGRRGSLLASNPGVGPSTGIRAGGVMARATWNDGWAAGERL